MTRIELMKQIEATIKKAQSEDWWGFDYEAAMKEIEAGFISLAKAGETEKEVEKIDFNAEATAIITGEIKKAIMQVEAEAEMEQLEADMQTIVEAEDEMKLVAPEMTEAVEIAEESKIEVKGEGDSLEALMKGVKAVNAERTLKMYSEFLSEKPVEYKRFKEIANEVYGEKGITDKFLKYTLQKKFINLGLIEWTGKAKNQIIWK